MTTSTRKAERPGSSVLVERCLGRAEAVRPPRGRGFESRPGHQNFFSVSSNLYSLSSFTIILTREKKVYVKKIMWNVKYACNVINRNLLSLLQPLSEVVDFKGLL